MTDPDLWKQIARRQRAIARFDEKAARCNVATDLGRAVATRAEDSANYHRRRLGKLQELLKNPGERGDMRIHAGEVSVATVVATEDKQTRDQKLE
jgi:hypothetical protein